tara:strand:+ start:103 stop:318 length:216 start_codon:yes stop_codon:yes gene_type:complete
MQNKQLTPDTIRAQKVSNLFYSQGNSSREKVDVNVLLNRVKFEKKSEIRKNLILVAGVIGTLSITAFITVI